MIFLSALVLMFVAMMFKLSDKKYKTALKITAIVGVIGIVFNVLAYLIPSAAVALGVLSLIIGSIIVAIWLIKKTYKLEWGKSLLVWLVWIVLEIVVAFIIGLIIAAIVAAVFVTSMV